MFNKEQSIKNNLRTLLIIFVVLASLTTIFPFNLKNGIQNSKSCQSYEDGSKMFSQTNGENMQSHLDCTPLSDKSMINLYLFGIVNIEELSLWVLGVDRRLIVLKMMNENKMIQASDIADSTKRSLQNITYAMRELEEKGLIKCLTPGKHTWKKYLPTEKGKMVFQKLKDDQII